MITNRLYNTRPYADRCAAHLGAQFKLGLWSERRSWHDPFDPARPIFDARHLNRNGPTRKKA
jgi:hypothetical protein